MSEIKYKNLNESAAYKKLKAYAGDLSLKKLLSPQRINEYEVNSGAGLKYNYAAKKTDKELLKILRELADERQLIEKYKSLLDGDIINTGEKRMVMHQLTRGQLGKAVIHNGKNLRDFYCGQQKRIADFAAKVHKGQLIGSTGKKFETIVQIGIGGSDLGPRALYLALKNWAMASGNFKMEAKFISNVDPDDAFDVLNGLELESSLFVIVSKSGTTQETLANKDLVLEFLKRKDIPGFNYKKHLLAVTSETSPMALSPEVLDSFYIDDFIGGRYSSTSAVGGLALSLAFGPKIFAELLEGAGEADKNALEPDILQNASLLDALLGVYERNILDLPVTAVLPYSQALSRFPAHLQQLDMESNGKSVDRFGEKLEYKTGPAIMGEPGTNGQHSFYQHLHQGTDVIPLQFIGFLDCQSGLDAESGGSTSRRKLNANLVAQIAAFALGKEDANPNKNFNGERPSSLLYAEKLTPQVLGALLAHFENKVMFQGFCWNINSFDQEGVQLGKVLTRQILEGDGENPILDAYAKKLRA